jgi:hypothetical protein
MWEGRRSERSRLQEPSHVPHHQKHGQGPWRKGAGVWSHPEGLAGRLSGLGTPPLALQAEPRCPYVGRTRS